MCSGVKGRFADHNFRQWIDETRRVVIGPTPGVSESTLDGTSEAHEPAQILDRGDRFEGA